MNEEEGEGEKEGEKTHFVKRINLVSLQLEKTILGVKTALKCNKNS